MSHMAWMLASMRCSFSCGSGEGSKPGRRPGSGGGLGRQGGICVGQRHRGPVTGWVAAMAG